MGAAPGVWVAWVALAAAELAPPRMEETRPLTDVRICSLFAIVGDTHEAEAAAEEAAEAPEESAEEAAEAPEERAEEAADAAELAPEARAEEAEEALSAGPEKIGA